MSVPSITGTWVADRTNKKSTGKKILGELKALSGASRITSVVSKSLKIGTAMSSNPSVTLDSVEKGLGFTSSVMGALRIPSVTADMVESYEALNDPNNAVSTERKVANCASTTLGAVSSYARAIDFLSLRTVPFVAPIAAIAEFGSDGIALPQEIDDLTQTSKLADSATDRDVKEYWTRSRNYHILSVVKTVVSIVSAILGLALVAFIPVVGFALIGLTITLLALTKDYYKALGKTEPYSFGKPFASYNPLPA